MMTMFIDLTTFRGYSTTMDVVVRELKTRIL